jgi:uncharacterized protein (DUF736 family)
MQISGPMPFQVWPSLMPIGPARRHQVGYAACHNPFPRRQAVAPARVTFELVGLAGLFAAQRNVGTLHQLLFEDATPAPKPPDGRYEGELRTLSIRAEVVILPVGDKVTPNQPDFRVLSQGIEIGAGWLRKGQASGKEYVSLSRSPHPSLVCAPSKRPRFRSRRPKPAPRGHARDCGPRPRCRAAAWQVHHRGP